MTTKLKKRDKKNEKYDKILLYNTLISCRFSRSSEGVCGASALSSFWCYSLDFSNAGELNYHHSASRKLDMTLTEVKASSGEILHKYNTTVMDHFAAVFKWLPLAAVISNTSGPNPLSVFVVHGGLSTNVASADTPADSKGVGAISLAAIEAVMRGREPPESGLMSDLLWSDPQRLNGRSLSKRGVGFSFGPDYTAAFLEKNDLQLMVRSHEVKDEGYEVEHGGKCITIFSAPNYCDQMHNKGAFIRFKEDMQPAFTQFECSPHPDIPPMRYAKNIFGL